MNNPQLWQAIAAVIAAYAALLGGLYAVITRPLQSQLTDIIRRLERIETKLAHIGKPPTPGLADVPDLLLLLTEELAVVDNLKGKISLIASNPLSLLKLPSAKNFLLKAIPAFFRASRYPWNLASAAR